MDDKFISVEVAKKAILAGLKLTREDEKRVCRILDCLPDADVRVNVRGEWLKRKVFDINDVSIEELQSAQCSKCGRYHTTPHRYYFKNFNFCPNCGAIMDKGEST